jgi:hypothetical protein
MTLGVPNFTANSSSIRFAIEIHIHEITFVIPAYTAVTALTAVTAPSINA